MMNIQTGILIVFGGLRLLAVGLAASFTNA